MRKDGRHRLDGCLVALASVVRRAPPWTARLHYWLRAISCPFDRIARHVPPAGTIVDFGCGLGNLSCRLQIGEPARRIIAIETDERKVDIAQHMFAHLPIEWRVGSSGPLPPCDAIVMVDVLYMLEPESQRALLAECFAALRPSGLLLLKIMGDGPAWKVAWDRFQDFVAVRLLQLHAPRAMHHATTATVQRWLLDAGFSVHDVDIAQGYPHPHLLLLATRPAARTL